MAACVPPAVVALGFSRLVKLPVLVKVTTRAQGPQLQHRFTDTDSFSPVDSCTRWSRIVNIWRPVRIGRMNGF